LVLADRSQDNPALISSDLHVLLASNRATRWNGVVPPADVLAEDLI
jgi:hypothetical protein